MAPKIHEVGMSCLSDADHNRSANIIFVHGLMGHPYESWLYRAPKRKREDSEEHHRPRFKGIFGSRSTSPAVSDSPSADANLEQSATNEPTLGSSNLLTSLPDALPDKNVFWPRDLLVPSLPTARVLTWGYKADLVKPFGSASQASLFQHAESLLEDIANTRSAEEERHRPIIFITHSLGGLVVKDALGQAVNTKKDHHRTILPAVAGIMFIGTPHRRSETTKLGDLFINSHLSRVVCPNPNTTLLQALGCKSPDIERLGAAFMNILEDGKFPIHSFREELTTHGGMVVADHSSAIGIGREGRGLLLADHFDMIKYSSKDDQNYRKVAFVDWLRDRRQPVFWIQGKPGSGKSTAMKFVINDSRTRGSLCRHRSEKWAIHGFFFYDQGPHALQKSTRGLFCEILWGILRQNRQLAQYVLPTYRKHIKDSESPIKSQIPRDARSELRWSLPNLREAFAAMCTQVTTPANILLFIDGLDEHCEPDQKTSVSQNELLDVLAAMTRTNGQDDVVIVRLCLASRSEPVFVSRLHSYPGLAMHMHTSKDIYTYVSTRLENQLSEKNREAKKELIDSITTTLSIKAQGVFIWVRLAVDELIQGVQEGASPEEFQKIYYELPPDLDGLYRRAIARSKSSWSGAAAKRRNQHVLQMHLVFFMAISGVSRNTRGLYDYECPEMVQHVASFFLRKVSQGTSGTPTDPLYVQIAESGAPRLVPFKGTAEKVTHYSENWALFVASHSGGLVEVSKNQGRRKKERKKASMKFIHRTAHAFARVLLTDHSWLVDIPEQVQTMTREDMVFGYDLARLRVQFENQTLVGTEQLAKFQNFALHLEKKNKEGVAPALVMLERVANPRLLTLTVSLSLEGFAHNGKHDIFPDFEGELGICHLALVTGLRLTFQDLLVRQTEKGLLTPEVVASLLFCRVLSGHTPSIAKQNDLTGSGMEMLLLALGQATSRSSGNAEMTFDHAYRLFAKYLNRGSKSELRRMLDKLLTTKPTVKESYTLSFPSRFSFLLSDSVRRKDWELQAHRARAMTDCYMTAVRRNSDAGYLYSRKVALLESALQNLSQELAASPSRDDDGVVVFFKKALKRWVADPTVMETKEEKQRWYKQRKGKDDSFSIVNGRVVRDDRDPQGEKIRCLLDRIGTIKHLKMRQAGGKKLNNKELKQITSESQLRDELAQLRFTE